MTYYKNFSNSSTPPCKMASGVKNAKTLAKILLMNHCLDLEIISQKFFVYDLLPKLLCTKWPTELIIEKKPLDDIT